MQFSNATTLLKQHGFIGEEGPGAELACLHSTPFIKGKHLHIMK